MPNVAGQSGRFDAAVGEVSHAVNCWRGDFAERRPEGQPSALRLRCTYYGAWVNGDGSTCERCRRRLWPEFEHWRHHLLPHLVKTKGIDGARQAILDLAARGRLEPTQVVQLGTDFVHEDLEPQVSNMRRGYSRAATREVTEGAHVIKVRVLPECRRRGRARAVRDIPCCGGKSRREELFECMHPRNPAGEAWSIVCQGCVLIAERADGGRVGTKR